MAKRKLVYLDMDGTIADLYSVEDWLEKLRTYQVLPYEEASALIDEAELRELFSKLRAKGYEIGIVTWGSKVSNAEYDERTARAKRKWIRKHIGKVDDFRFSAHGIPKHKLVGNVEGAVLIDDEKSNLYDWRAAGGYAIEAKNPKRVVKALKALCRDR